MTLSEIKKQQNDNKLSLAADSCAQKAEDYTKAIEETDERIKFAVRAGFPNVTVGYGYPDKENAALAKKVMKNYKELNPVYEYKGWDHVAAGENPGVPGGATRVTVTYT